MYRSAWWKSTALLFAIATVVGCSSDNEAAPAGDGGTEDAVDGAEASADGQEAGSTTADGGDASSTLTDAQIVTVMHVANLGEIRQAQAALMRAVDSRVR